MRVVYEHHESSAAFPERGLKKRKKNVFPKWDPSLIHENLMFT